MAAPKASRTHCFFPELRPFIMRLEGKGKRALAWGPCPNRPREKCRRRSHAHAVRASPPILSVRRPPPLSGAHNPPFEQFLSLLRLSRTSRCVPVDEALLTADRASAPVGPALIDIQNAPQQWASAPCGTGDWRSDRRCEEGGSRCGPGRVRAQRVNDRPLAHTRAREDGPGCSP